MKRRRVSTEPARAQFEIEDDIDGSNRSGEEEERNTIKLGTYNIRDGRNGGLESALRAMAKGNVDLGVFQETKLPPGIYTRHSSGYHVMATASPN